MTKLILVNTSFICPAYDILVNYDTNTAVVSFFVDKMALL